MNARKLSGALPQVVPVVPPSNFFVTAKEVNGDRFFAFRNTAPVFAFEGTDPQEVFDLAEKTVSDFLAKMHRFGFRI